MRLLVLPIASFLAALTLQVNWSSTERNGIKVTVPFNEEFVQQCVRSGLELRYRFEARLCHRRSLWIDSCQRERIETKSIKYDALGDQYSVVSDLHQDKTPPAIVEVSSSEEAISQVSTIPEIRFGELPGGESGHPVNGYIEVRVISECKGASIGLLGHLPLILSLGMIDVAVSDSGWTAFNLPPAAIPKE